jgi:hypothetical protein
MGSRKEDDDDDDKAVDGEVKTAEERKAEEKRMAIREQNRMSIGRGHLLSLIAPSRYKHVAEKKGKYIEGSYQRGKGAL